MTPKEQEQKLLDIAFEPDCTCHPARKRVVLAIKHHKAACPWRRWKQRMDSYDS